jgi:hypothetical protein
MRIARIALALVWAASCLATSQAAEQKLRPQDIYTFVRPDLAKAFRAGTQYPCDVGDNKYCEIPLKVQSYNDAEHPEFSCVVSLYESIYVKPDGSPKRRRAVTWVIDGDAKYKFDPKAKAAVEIWPAYSDGDELMEAVWFRGDIIKGGKFVWLLKKHAPPVDPSNGDIKYIVHIIDTSKRPPNECMVEDPVIGNGNN